MENGVVPQVSIDRPKLQLSLSVVRSLLLLACDVLLGFVNQLESFLASLI